MVQALFGEGGINSYAYCNGDPVNYQDDTGHNPLSSAWRWITNKTTKIMPKAKTLIERREEARVTLQRHPSLKKFEPIVDNSVKPEELRSVKRAGKARDYISSVTSEDLTDPFMEAAYENVKARERKLISQLESILPAYAAKDMPTNSPQSPGLSNTNRSIRAPNP